MESQKGFRGARCLQKQGQCPQEQSPPGGLGYGCYPAAPILIIIQLIKTQCAYPEQHILSLRACSERTSSSSLVSKVSTLPPSCRVSTGRFSMSCLRAFSSRLVNCSRSSLVGKDHMCEHKSLSPRFPISDPLSCESEEQGEVGGSREAVTKLGERIRQATWSDCCGVQISFCTAPSSNMWQVYKLLKE